ncbi:MAG: response regulator [Leptospiraceae bacterium]|nr:response regulator [Leptospiraceae bacterium]
MQTKLGDVNPFCLSWPWYEKKDIGKSFENHYRNKFFLYIDDDEITRKIFKNQMLQISNFVDVAENSLVGIQMMNSKNYDIVFIDMNLGGELGINLVKQLKTTNSSSNTKYVLCSGDVSADSISQFQNYGFDYAMPKDFRAEKLLQVVQFLLN